MSYKCIFSGKAVPLVSQPLWRHLLCAGQGNRTGDTTYCAYYTRVTHSQCSVNFSLDQQIWGPVGDSDSLIPSIPAQVQPALLSETLGDTSLIFSDWQKFL